MKRFNPLDFIECKASTGSGGSGGSQGGATGGWDSDNIGQGAGNSGGGTTGPGGSGNSGSTSGKGHGGWGFSDALHDNFAGALRGEAGTSGGWGSHNSSHSGSGDGHLGGLGSLGSLGYSGNYTEAGLGHSNSINSGSFSGFGMGSLTAAGLGLDTLGQSLGYSSAGDRGDGTGYSSQMTTSTTQLDPSVKSALDELSTISKAVVEAVNKQVEETKNLSISLTQWDAKNPLGSMKAAMDVVSGKINLDHPENKALQISVTNSRVSVTNKVDGMELGGWKNDAKSPTGISGYGIGQQLELGNTGRLGVGHTFTSYEVVDNKLNYNVITSTFKTEKINDKNYSHKTTSVEYGSFSTTTREGYLNHEIGGVNKANITYDTVIGKFTIDYHYWNTVKGAVEFGYMAELAMDVLEVFDVDMKTAGNIAKGVEIASILAFSVVPGLRTGLLGLKMLDFNKAIGLATMLSGFTSAYQGVMNIGDILGVSLDKFGVTTDSPHINNFFSGGDNDLSKVNDDISENFNESPLGLESMFLRSNDILPVTQDTPTQKIKREYANITEGELNMEANLPTELVGMNNSKASNLLSINEAQYLENVILYRGIVESSTKDTEVHNSIDTDCIYLYDDDGFTGGIKYKKSQNVSIAQLANTTYCVVDGVVHMLNTKVNGIADIKDRLLTLKLEPGNIALEIATNLSEAKIKEIDKMVDEMRVVAEAEKSYISEPKKGQLPDYVKVNASIDAEDYKKKFKECLKNGIRKAVIKGSTDAADGKKVAIILGGLTETAVARDKRWQVELDLLVAFGSIFNRFSNDELSYAVTVYDPKTGRESNPVKNDMSLTYDTKVGIKIKNIPAGFKAKLYRRNVGSTLYKYIATVDKEDYEDNLTDIPSAQYLDFREIHDVDELKGLVEHKATLFAFKGPNVYFTRPGKPNTWNELQSVTINENVIAMASSPLGLVVFSKNTTYLLGGTDKFNYTLANVSQSIGCSSALSVQNIKNAIIWEFNGYLMVSIGSAINNITRGRFELPKGKIINSVVVGDVYYLFMDTKVVKLDFNTNQPQITLIDYKNAFSISLNHDLYYLQDGKVYKSYDDETQNNVMTYITNKFVGGSFDLTKEWNSVNIVYSGDLEISVYIDDKEVVSRHFTSDSQDVANIGIPVDHNEGLGIYLKIVGVGKVYNYRYIFDNRNMR